MLGKNRFLQVSGIITAFRRSEPNQDAIGAMRINGGRWIHVSLNDLSYRHTIVIKSGHSVRRDAVEMNADRVAGVIKRAVGQKVDIGVRCNEKSGDCALLWLVLPNSVQLNMKTPTENREEAGKSLRRWLPWTLIFLVIAVFGFYYQMVTLSSGMALLSLVAAFASFFCGAICYFSLSELYVSYFDGPLRQSWRALAALESGKSFSNQKNKLPPLMDVGVTRNGDSPLSSPARDDHATPPLRRVCGRATHITVDKAETGTSFSTFINGNAVYINNRVNYASFRFNIGAESFCMFAATKQGLRKRDKVFLAENDRVVVVIIDDASQLSTNSSLVLGLHNLEDQQTYICHLIMVTDAKKLRQPFIGKYRSAYWTQRDLQFASRRLKWPWLFMIVFFLGLDKLLDHKTNWLLEIGIPTLFMTICYAALAIPLAPWRDNCPSTRQRLANRIYALLGLPSAFNLPADVHIV